MINEEKKRKKKFATVFWKLRSYLSSYSRLVSIFTSWNLYVMKSLRHEIKKLPHDYLHSIELKFLKHDQYAISVCGWSIDGSTRRNRAKGRIQERSKTVYRLKVKKKKTSPMRLKWTFRTFGDIWGHFEIFWDILTSLEHLNCFPSHFRPFSPIIGSLKKRTDGPTDRRTDGPTDRRTDPPIEMRGRI